MQNYYELLQVPPDSSNHEIEEAIDAFYNETRRRVTSFDPNIATKANQDLILLEDIRNTLLNPQLRTEYDQKIGKQLTTSGLLDPTAPIEQQKPRSLGMPSPGAKLSHPEPAPSPQASQYTKDTWTCTNCRQENPQKTLYCKSCGGLVGHTCPKCKQTWEIATTEYCPNCGHHLATEIHRKKIHDAINQAEQKLKATEALDLNREFEIAPLKPALLQIFTWATAGVIYQIATIFPGIIEQIFVGVDVPYFFAVPIFVAAITLSAAIVFMILLRVGPRSSFGALLSSVIWGFSIVVINQGWMIADFMDYLLFSGLLFIVDIVFAQQPGKFANNFKGSANWLKVGNTITVLAVLVVILLGVSNNPFLNGFLYVWNGPLNVGDLLIVLTRGLYFGVSTVLLIFGLWGWRHIIAIQQSLNRAKKEKQSTISQLKSEISLLKQDLDNIPR